MNKKYALYIGRWQTPYLHDGHIWCFEQSWKDNIPVLIAIRNVEVDDKNPYTAEEVEINITNQLSKKISEGLCKVIIIPDIESIKYGRDVGYKVEELIPPNDISKISASKIRNNEK